MWRRHFDVVLVPDDNRDLLPPGRAFACRNVRVEDRIDESPGARLSEFGDREEAAREEFLHLRLDVLDEHRQRRRLVEGEIDPAYAVDRDGHVPDREENERKQDESAGEGDIAQALDGSRLSDDRAAKPDEAADEARNQREGAAHAEQVLDRFGGDVLPKSPGKIAAVVCDLVFHVEVDILVSPGLDAKEGEDGSGVRQVMLADSFQCSHWFSPSRVLVCGRYYICRCTLHRLEHKNIGPTRLFMGFCCRQKGAFLVY